MKNRFFKWFESLTVGTRVFLNALTTSLPFYFAAFLSSSVAEAYKAEVSQKIFIHFGVFICLIILITFLYRILCFKYDAYKSDVEQEHSALYHAFTLCDRTVVKQHRRIKNCFSDPSNKLRALIASVDRIQEIVDDTYSTFESIYGSHERSSDRIDFEVTFMTKSNEDGNITIPSSANRSGRKPRSLILREENVAIYNDTETAKLYNMKRPYPIIVPDTSDSKYAEIYPRQKERIKSSIIYPVLCEDNILLGTLVVHCDRPGFFKEDREKFWADLLEIFSKRISVEKMKLDKLDEMTRVSAIQINLEHKILF